MRCKPYVKNISAKNYYIPFAVIFKKNTRTRNEKKMDKRTAKCEQTPQITITDCACASAFSTKLPTKYTELACWIYATLRRHQMLMDIKKKKQRCFYTHPDIYTSSLEQALWETYITRSAHRNEWVADYGFIGRGISHSNNFFF